MLEDYISANEPRLDIGVDFKPCYVRLERDRNMVNSFDVCWYASKMVENAQNAELLKKSIDSYSGQYIMCECVPEDLKNEIAEDFINEYGAKAAPVTDQKDMEALKKRGYKPVIVSEAKKRLSLLLHILKMWRKKTERSENPRNRYVKDSVILQKESNPS